eukprot:8543458-Heterocapsa_arctica.AAC.1
MAMQAILRRAQAPREPAGKRIRRTEIVYPDHMHGPPDPRPPDPRTQPEAPQETGPTRRYR